MLKKEKEGEELGRSSLDVLFSFIIYVVMV